MTRTITLATIVSSPGSVEFDGETYVVEHASGVAMDLIESIQGAKDHGALYQAAALCAPTLAPRIKELNAHQAAAIIALATKGVEAVEAMFPNVMGATEAESPSSPATLSDTSSSALPA